MLMNEKKITWQLCFHVWYCFWRSINHTEKPMGVLYSCPSPPPPCSQRQEWSTSVLFKASLKFNSRHLMGSIKSTEWDKAMCTGDLVQEVTKRSRGQGTRRVREMRRTLKKSALRSSLLWAVRAWPSRNYLRGIHKGPQKRPPRGQETGAFIHCVLPPLVEGWPWGVNIPPLWGCTCMGVEQATVASEKALGKRTEKHTAHTWSLALSAQGEYEPTRNCPLQLWLKTELGWGEMTWGARGICYIRHLETFWPSYWCWKNEHATIVIIFFPVFLLEYGSNNYMFKACGIFSEIQMLGTNLCIFLWHAWGAEQAGHWLLDISSS